MENNNTVSPFVVAEAYRVGQQDGFKAGLIVGVGAVVLIKAVSKHVERRIRVKIQKNQKK